MWWICSNNGKLPGPAKIRKMSSWNHMETSSFWGLGEIYDFTPPLSNWCNPSNGEETGAASVSKVLIRNCEYCCSRTPAEKNSMFGQIGATSREKTWNGVFLVRPFCPWRRKNGGPVTESPSQMTSIQVYHENPQPFISRGLFHPYFLRQKAFN